MRLSALSFSGALVVRNYRNQSNKEEKSKGKRKGGKHMVLMLKKSFHRYRQRLDRLPSLVST